MVNVEEKQQQNNNNNNIGRLILSDFKTSSKPIKIKAVWYWQENCRQLNRIEQSSQTWHTELQSTGDKISYSTNDVLTAGYLMQMKPPGYVCFILQKN